MKNINFGIAILILGVVMEGFEPINWGLGIIGIGFAIVGYLHKK